MSSVNEIEQKLSSHKEEIAKLERLLEIAKQESPNEQLARTLHSLLCGFNHTEQCGWYYEIVKGVDNWNGDSHGRYLTKANMVIKKCKDQHIQVDDIVEIVKMLKDPLS